jgi:hypothetical protein
MNARSLLVLAATASLGLAAPIACSAPADTGEHVAQGTVSMALTAIGPDGATYTFPSNTFFVLTQSGTTVASAQFDQTTPTQSFSLPVGSYSGTLQNAAANGTTWTLVRTVGGTSTNATATLVDPSPYSLTITSGTTTNVTFHFTVAGVGNLTFQTGTLGTALQVDAGTGAPTGAAYSGPFNVSGQSLTGTPAQNSFLTIASGSASYQVTLTRTGDWAPGLDQACMPVSAGVTAVSSSGLLQGWMGELAGATGTVCIGDASQNNAVTLQLQRIGAPKTPAMKVGLTGPSYSFTLLLSNPLPSPVYAGGTLSLSKLATPGATLASGGGQLMIADATVSPFAPVAVTYGVAPGGTFVITP